MAPEQNSSLSQPPSDIIPCVLIGRYAQVSILTLLYLYRLSPYACFDRYYVWIYGLFRWSVFPILFGLGFSDRMFACDSHTRALLNVVMA